MSPPTNAAAHRKHAQNRHALVDRCSTIRACEPCRRRKRLCNGQKPCSLCKAESNECVYSVISDHPRGVFTTNTARRLSSGSACETCRRRKTKCDGSNPCAFCAANNLKCINNAERRKRATGSDHEAIDRIEDRLRRIEQLMTVFTPSPLSQSTVYASEDGSRRPYNSTNNNFNIPAHFVRQQRHSVQGITVAKEQMELQMARRVTAGSATMLRQPSNPSSQPLTSSMLNLTLSPSSSTSSSSNTSSMQLPQSSIEKVTHSLLCCIDQLSKRTFAAGHSDYPVRSSYPIYPLSPSPPIQLPPTTTYAEASFSP
ncbi:hypothetical protein BCR42DRAFT_366994 [Absidia repens]|uniref:Zn(2)-C6 fungal-type domain-containing protein n=1 Tax=Absidia repens TaxID=90262 RepID=A0A1X2IWD1_9FUNG|nr:hypothetical protein BCR42DRAFT_366994 [Absidia repens]